MNSAEWLVINGLGLVKKLFNIWFYGMIILIALFVVMFVSINGADKTVEALHLDGYVRFYNWLKR